MLQTADGTTYKSRLKVLLVSCHWPRRSLLVRICEAVDRYLAGCLPEPTATDPPRDLLWLG